MARPTEGTQRTTERTAASRQERPAPVPPRVPPSLRHCEVACATILWISFLPLGLLLSSGPKVAYFTSIVSVVVLIFLLLLHSCTLRPFYTETGDLDTHDEYGELWVIDGPRDHDDVHHSDGKVTANRMDGEECKLVLLCMLVLSSVGCAISMANGGAFVFRFWTARSAADCSVSNLEQLRLDGYTRFSCHDGYVDFDKQLATIQEAQRVQGSTYTTYIMAPIYQKPDDALPVAWATAKNVHLDSGFQAQFSDHAAGLSGIMVTGTPKDSTSCMSLICATEKDVQGYNELKHAFAHSLNASSGWESHNGFDFQDLPTVELISDASSAPQGLLRHFIYALVMYFATLIGLIAVQVDYIKEARSRPQSGQSTETRYEALGATSQ